METPPKLILHNVRTVRLGQGVAEECAADLAEAGCRRVLIVTGAPLRAFDLERLVAALDPDVERRLDRSQVLLEVAGEVGEARVVGRDEGVAKDHGYDVAAGDGLSLEAASIIAP